jgi:hypothetical protein
VFFMLTVFKKLSVIISTILLFSHLILAGGEEWRPVNPEDVALKESRVEKDADAEAIFWEIRIDDSSTDELSEKHYIRVKVFTERGREKYSKIDIPYAKGTRIKDVAARVIKADGTIIELQKTDIFDREIVKADGVKIKAKSFAVPNIEAGVIIEYKYKEVTDDAGAVGMHLVFQRDIPVQNISYYYKPFSGRDPMYQWFNMSDTKFVKDKNGFYVASKSNVPSFKEEPRMPPEEEVLPWYLLQSVRYTITGESATSVSFSIKNPGNRDQYWAAVSNENAVFTKLVTDAAKDKEIKRTAAEITASASTPEEKLRKLYDFCQKEIKNVDFDPAITDELKAKLPSNKKLADVLKNRSAGVQFIDMLFGAMASSLGLETRVAILGNRNKKFFNPNITNDRFIHLGVIAVKTPEGWKFFNPGVSFLPYGTLMWYEEDVWAMLVGEKDYIWLQTPFSDVEKTVAQRTGKFQLSEDGTLEGDVSISYTGQMGVAYKMDNYDESANQREEDLKNDIKRRISAAEVNNITMENVIDPANPFVYKFKVKVPNYAQKTGKRLFLQPGFFEYGEHTTFSSANRKYDIYFHYPWSENDHIEITLPKGYGLDSADAPAAVEDPNKIGSDVISIRVDPAQTFLIYDRKFHFGKNGNYLFQASAYQPLKNLFDAFFMADSHVLTLKQK